MTFAAGNCQTIANYLLSQMVVWEVDFPGGVDVTNIKFRALQWAVSEAILILCIGLNYLPGACPSDLARRLQLMPHRSQRGPTPGCSRAP